MENCEQKQALIPKIKNYDLNHDHSQKPSRSTKAMDDMPDNAHVAFIIKI